MRIARVISDPLSVLSNATIIGTSQLRAWIRKKTFLERILHLTKTPSEGYAQIQILKIAEYSGKCYDGILK